MNMKIKVNSIEYDNLGPNGTQRKIVHTDVMLHVYHLIGGRWRAANKYPIVEQKTEDVFHEWQKDPRPWDKRD